MRLYILSTMCSSSGGQHFIIQHMLSSHSDGHLQSVMIPDAV